MDNAIKQSKLPGANLNMACKLPGEMKLFPLPVDDPTHKIALAQAIRTQGLTKSDVAQKLGVDSSTIMRWLSGDTKTPRLTIRKVLEITGELPWLQYG